MNPTEAIQQAIARRAGGTPSPQLSQVSDTAAVSNPVPAPTPISSLTQASAPQEGQSAQVPGSNGKWQPTDQEGFIVAALAEQLKNSHQLKKEQMKMAQAPQMSMGGGGMYSTPKVNC